jgi:phenylpropionate dioxygenase-like ring-hydroxylating dioxygenase large terminal subunit
MTEVPREPIPKELRLGLRNYWYPVIDSAQLGTERPVAITRLGEKLVVWRDGDGAPHVFVDYCAHRSAPLSVGDCVNGRLQCRYHGLQYDGNGQCRLVPIELEEDGPLAQRISVTSYPTSERGGFIWSYLGDVVKFPPGPLVLNPVIEDPAFASTISESVWNANWLLVHDNTSDALHFPFLHGHFSAYFENGQVQFGPAGPGNPAVTPEITLNTVRQRFVPQRTPRGVHLSIEGREEGAGRQSDTFDEITFELPCLAAVWVPFPDGGHPHRFLQYQYPIDEDHTIVYAWVGKQFDREEHREQAQWTVENFAIPVARQVYGEDSWICQLQGDLDRSRASEHLLPTDAGPLAIRRCILEAYEAQLRHLTGDAADGNREEEAATTDRRGASVR